MTFSKDTQEFLLKVLENDLEKPVVRHEVLLFIFFFIKNQKAGEALSNSGDIQNLPYLSKFIESLTEEVRVTCQLGVKKIETFENLKRLTNN